MTHNEVLKKLTSMKALWLVRSSSTARTEHRLARCAANPMIPARTAARIRIRWSIE